MCTCSTWIWKYMVGLARFNLFWFQVSDRRQFISLNMFKLYLFQQLHGVVQDSVLCPLLLITGYKCSPRAEVMAWTSFAIHWFTYTLNPTYTQTVSTHSDGLTDWQIWGPANFLKLSSKKKSEAILIVSPGTLKKKMKHLPLTIPDFLTCTTA